MDGRRGCFDRRPESVRVEIIYADVKIKRDDGSRRSTSSVSACGKSAPASRSGSRWRPLDERVVARIFPAGAVVAVVADEHSEECVRVVVITDPARARELIIQAVHALQKTFHSTWRKSIWMPSVSRHICCSSTAMSSSILMRHRRNIIKSGKPFSTGIAGFCQ